MLSRYEYDAKDAFLKEGRGIGFKDIITLIEGGKVVDIFNHPNQKRYPGQLIYAVDINGYIYLVPFIEKDKKHFLKTIFPSRKATKQYLRGKSDETG